ncbi:MAG: hypothetical protein M1150_01970 [Patescibacteria group bacterium]|nr:hypothetical protein [Patescibacteria group bacterium]
MNEGQLRNENWLLYRLDYVWRNYFADVPQTNRVFVKFGRQARFRFGSIRYCYGDNSTHIRINGLFRDPSVPSEIVDHTLAHELAHYTHGFSSPHPKMHLYPHRGGIIDKELTKRGLGHLIKFYNIWVKNYIKSLSVLVLFSPVFFN